MTEALIKFAIKESPARLKLANLIDQKNVAEDKLRSLDGQVARLSAVVAGESSAKARVCAFDAEHAGKMAAWANDAAASEVPPAVDHKARAALDADLKSASEAATAARAALAPVRDHQAKIAAKLQAVIPSIHAASMLVVVEETAAKIDDLETVAKQFNKRLCEASRLIGFIADAANSSRFGFGAMQPVLSGVEQLNYQLGKAASGVTVGHQSRFVRDDALTSLVKALLTNPMATLDG